ncbi:hypothetical protein NS506_01410 [Nocardia seriolae]|uniref:Uncharacterized protein n=1 Tax=Nocardia seriolae TaxID=37332 RepID=A0ABC8AMQ8_9NOCA|nr:hypothetical protein NS506_01410 [Nocardia seriolae]
MGDWPESTNSPIPHRCSTYRPPRRAGSPPTPHRRRAAARVPATAPTGTHPLLQKACHTSPLDDIHTPAPRNKLRGKTIARNLVSGHQRPLTARFRAHRTGKPFEPERGATAPPPLPTHTPREPLQTPGSAFLLSDTVSRCRTDRSAPSQSHIVPPTRPRESTTPPYRHEWSPQRHIASSPDAPAPGHPADPDHRADRPPPPPRPRTRRSSHLRETIMTCTNTICESTIGYSFNDYGVGTLN